MHASGERPFLYYSKAIHYVTVYDGRNPASPSRQRYDGVAAGVIELCNEAAKSVDQIRLGLRTAYGEEAVAEEELTAALTTLTSQRILYEERGRYFTLAIPENPYL